MAEWTLIALPLTWAFIWGLLVLSDVAEHRILSPRALIVRTARSRGTRPEHAERLVATEFDRLLRDLQR